MKKTVIILTILLLTTTITQPIKSEETIQTYYVAKNGNDNNPGTEQEPWLTLNKAGQTATAGDTIYVKQGIYNEQLNIENSGNENNYITFSAYSTDEVIIDGTYISLNWNGLIRLDNIGYVKISGFKIQNSEYFGIYCKNTCNNLIIQNNEITNCQSSGIIIYPSSSGNPHHIYIYNNTIDTVCMNMNQEALSLSKVNVFEITNNKVFNSYKEGIDVKNGCSNGIIQENEVSNHDTIRPCIYVDAHGRDSYNIIIQKNTAYDNGQGICLATEEGGTLENIIICNNIIYTKNNGFGIHRFTTPGSHQKKDIYVINNLFHMTADGTCIMLTDNEEHFSNFIIRNNILSGTDYHMITTSFQEYTTIQVDHNLFTSASNYYGENYIIGDPKFNDITTNNFQLQANSPAIDSGNPQLAPSHDYNNIPRPQGEQIDIGPYEYQEDTTTPSNEHPTANDDSVTVSEDSVDNLIDVLVNDVDIDGDEIDVIGVSIPSHGTATYTASYVYYTPDPDYTGADQFGYTITDNNGSSDSATVFVTVDGMNDHPVANDNVATVMEDSLDNQIDVLANDNDPDGDSLSITGVTVPLYGTATYTASYVFYTPDVEYTGSDQFSYMISDGNGGTDSATVYVTVTSANDPPMANDDTATVLEDSSNNQIDVLANDNDPDGDDLTVVSVTIPAHGSASTDGNYTYYSSDSDYTGDDSFTYTISDGHGNSDTATVSVAVTHVNDPPTATLVPPSQNRTVNVFLPASLKVIVNDSEKQVINVTFYNANNQSIIGTDRVVGDNEIASTYWTDLTFNTTYRWYVTVDDSSSVIREPEEPYGYWEFTTIKDPTIPITPTDFLANAYGRFQINLTWSKEENVDLTYIEYHTIKDDSHTIKDDSWEIGDHQFLYNNTGNSTILDDLNPDAQRYFKAWSWNKTANIFSPVGIMNNAITESNNVPFYSNEYPVNNTIVQDLTLVWNITITDFDRDDVLQWTIECGNYKVGKNNDTSGSKSFLLPMLKYNGKYVIWINSSDTYDTTSEWFCFFTAEDDIFIIPPEPSSNGQQPPAFIPIEQTEKNNPPSDQILITGPSIIELGVMYGYHCYTFDIDNDMIQYRFDWGDGTYSEWSEYVTSNNSVLMNHSWDEKPFDNISVLAQDEHGLQTNWSEPFIITINRPPAFQNITFTTDIEKETIFNDTVILNISVNQTMIFTPNDLFDINESNYLLFNWDFGDGTEKNGTQITHVYNKTGEYIVNLSAIDQKGNEHHFKKRIVVNAGSNIPNLDISPKKQDISKNILIFIFLIITSLVTMIILFIFRRKIFFNSIKTPHKPYYQNFNTKSKQDKNLVSKTINNNVMTKRPLFITSTLNQNDNAYDKNMSILSINSNVPTTNINKSTDTGTEEISIHHKIEEKNILSYKDSISQDKTHKSSHASSEENIDTLVDELINSKKKI